MCIRDRDETTNAYRVLHGDSDGLGGLVVDRYADVLSLEVSTLAVGQRRDRWLPLLHRLCGTCLLYTSRCV